MILLYLARQIKLVSQKYLKPGMNIESQTDFVDPKNFMAQTGLFLSFILLSTFAGEQALASAGASTSHSNKIGALAMNSYESTLQQWRNEQEQKLRSEAGWLTVVGLTWLHEGVNTVGSSPKSQVVLPKPVPEELGELVSENNKFYFRLPTKRGWRSLFHSDSSAKNQPAASDGKSASNDGASGPARLLLDQKPLELTDAADSFIALRTDEGGKASEFQFGSVTFFLIRRGDKVGVRIKDSKSEGRLNFKGRTWFPANPHLKINARWIKHDQPIKLLVPDVLGNENHEDSPGHAEFEIEGQKVSLYPTIEDGKLFFVFKDKSAGKETYGASRFLHAEMPKSDRLEIDFNKAVNPPCAFTNYATCPLPPPQNILPVRILAGEMKPPGH